MLETKKLQTPNSRLITQSFVPKHLSMSWSALIVECFDRALELENLILTETRFQLANPFFTFYFFTHPSDAQFFTTSYWVAKEVIGPPQYDLDDRYQIEDLESGEVESVTVENFFKFDHKGPNDNGELALAKLLGEIPAQVKNWRVEIDCEALPYQLRVQFGASCLQT